MTTQFLALVAFTLIGTGLGFLSGWSLGRDAWSRQCSYIDWVTFGVARHWVDRSTTPELHAAYVEHMGDTFDASRARAKYDWPSYDREWMGRPE